MDPIWIGAILILVLLLALVFAFLFFYKEQSFEDAIASQKASSETLSIQSSRPVVKSLKVLKHRKKPKKEKDPKTKIEENIELERITKESELFADPAATPTTTLEDENPSFPFESTPERSSAITESSEEEKPIPKPRKKPKDRKRSGRSHADETPVQKEQEPQKKKPVIDEMIVEEVVQKVESQPDYEVEPPIDVEEVILPNQEISVQAPPSTSSSKKLKKSKAAKDKNLPAESLNVQSLVESLDTASLTNNEIQKLVDVLLDKQKNAEQWKTSGARPDPLDVLKKQLSEKEVAYQEEHSRADSLAVKTKEIREELLQEKTKHKSTDNAANQKIKALQKDNEALQMRMSASHSNNSLEMQKLQAALQDCKENHGQSDWRDLQEMENQRTKLKETIASLESELKTRIENENLLTKKAAEANGRVESLDTLQHSLSQQLLENVKAKSESEQRLQIVKNELAQAQTHKSDAVKNAEALQKRLEDEASKKTELEKMYSVKLKSEQGKHTEEKKLLEQQLESARGEKKDNIQLAELQKQSDEASQQFTELQAKLAQAEEDHGRSKQALSTKEEQLNKHGEEINVLKSSNSNKDEEIESLRQRVSVHESEIVVMKNNMSQDLEATPDGDDDRVQSLEADIEKLRTEIQERKEQFNLLEKSAEHMKKKNNDLREKNWKAMDALSTAEKNQKSELGKAVATVKEENKKSCAKLYADTKVYLCAIHPTISVDQDMPYEKFLKEYETKTKELGCGSPKPEVDETRVDELEAELEESSKKNDDLVAQCEKYKLTLGSTVDELEAELKESSKKNDDLVAQCEKYKLTLGSTVDKLEAELKESSNKNDDLVAQCEKYKLTLGSTVDELEAELEESSKKNDDLVAQCEKYKLTLGSTENMLHELEKNVEIEISGLKTSVENKDSELKKLNISIGELKENLRKAEGECKSKDCKIAALETDLPNKEELSSKEAELKTLNISVGELKENLQKAEEECKSRDCKIAALEKDLPNKEDLSSKEAELKKMALSIAELKESLRKADDESKSKDSNISSLQKDISTKESHLNKINVSVDELKENVRKSGEECKSKDSKVSSLEEELSKLKKSAESSSDTSKNELKKLSEELERFKEQEKSLRLDLEAAEKESSVAKARVEEDKSPELEKYKNEASDAAKVNAELRKELESVRIEYGDLKSSSPKKKQSKGNNEKIKSLEDQLAKAAANESELHAKISALEDSKSTTSVDEEPGASPDSKDKKKKGSRFSLMGSKSSKHETKYKDISEKYEQAKSENDEKSSRIAELESKLQKSEKDLQAQEEKLKEVSDNLQKAQENGLANGGVQNVVAKPLNDLQMKQMAEAMNDGENPGSAV